MGEQHVFPKNARSTATHDIDRHAAQGPHEIEVTVGEGERYKPGPRFGERQGKAFSDPVGEITGAHLGDR